LTGPSNFWSRRKADVKAEAAAEAREQADAIEARARASALAAEQEKSDEELLAELELPAPESLAQGDDFSAFMDRAVPERLRRRALRHLWRSNPVLANVDGLVDYGEDFSGSANVVENLKTAYQVGKGLTKHVEEMEKERERAAAASPVAQPGHDTPETAQTAAPDMVVSDEEQAPESRPDTRVDTDETKGDQNDATPALSFVAPDDAELTPARARRMQFAFEA